MPEILDERYILMILVLLLVLNIILLLLRTRQSKAANIGKEDLKELLREL